MNILLIKLFTIVSMAYACLLLIAVFFSDKLIFLPQQASYSLNDDLIIINSPTVDSSGNFNTIALRYLPNPQARYTIIYSHGNAVDIGQLKHLQQQFYNNGYSSIFYDYSGYGISSGMASEQQVYNDINAVYNFTRSHTKPENIIAFGHSLGSAVATYLASNKPVAALILESAFTSAFRVKTVYSIMPFEKFDTLSRVQRLSTPLFITHSRDDKVIAFWHSKALYDSTNSLKESLWLNKSGHSGITHQSKFWQHFKRFTDKLNTQ